MQSHHPENIPHFLTNLVKIFKDNKYSDILQWNDQYNGFLIKNQHQLEEILLPKFFRHKNISSFIRQLNIYGFKKIKTPSEIPLFSNELFHPHLDYEGLRIIKRNANQKKNHHKENINPKVTFSTMPAITKGEVEDDIIETLKGITSKDNISKTIIEFKKKQQYSKYLRDHQFLSMVCSKAGIDTPRQEECLSQLSIEEEMNDNKELISIESMKLVQSKVALPSQKSLVNDLLPI